MEPVIAKVSDTTLSVTMPAPVLNHDKDTIIATLARYDDAIIKMQDERKNWSMLLDKSNELGLKTSAEVEAEQAEALAKNQAEEGTQTAPSETPAQ